MKVLVVGAGPGGLSAALALAQRGVDVQVVEVKADRSTLGSELWLSSANLRTLDALGVADKCVEVGCPIVQPSRFLKADGELIAELSPPRVTREGLPLSVGIQRRALHDVLYDSCVAHGVMIQHGATVTQIHSDEHLAMITFSDGSKASADLVIGADGVNSSVREMVFPEAPKPEFVGQGVWRIRVPYEGPPRLDLYAAPFSSAGFITVSKDLAYIFCLVNADENKRVSKDDLIPEALKALAPFGGDIAKSLGKINDPTTVNYSLLRPVLVKPNWYKGRVLLIGDAAHAVTPHLAHGAGLAIEDGLVIGEELQRNPDISRALKAFMARRFGRCAFTVETTVQLSKLQQASPFPTPEQARISHAGTLRLAEPI